MRHQINQKTFVDQIRSIQRNSKPKPPIYQKLRTAVLRSSVKKRSGNFQKVYKKHPWRSLILVKWQTFTAAATGGVFCEKRFS